MTTEELTACFEKFEKEFLKFKNIVAPRHPRPDLCAFLMLHDLCPGDRDMVAGAEHDEIFLDVDLEKFAAAVTEPILRDLIRCGVRLGEYEGLAMFV